TSKPVQSFEELNDRIQKIQYETPIQQQDNIQAGVDAEPGISDAIHGGSTETGINQNEGTDTNLRPGENKLPDRTQQTDAGETLGDRGGPDNNLSGTRTNGIQQPGRSDNELGPVGESQTGI